MARRGRPIATPLAVASGGTGGSVIACSYAAKAKGVHRGQKIREARLSCPGLVVVPQHPPTYVDYHKQMLAVADEVVPLRHTFSVDEAAFELLPGPVMPLLERLGDAVPAALGDPVQVSLGVAPSILLAKLAAESDKPRCRRVLYGTDEELAEFKVQALAGVGPAMTAKLQKNGIRTLADLHRLGPATARALWGGRHGRDLWMELDGMDIPPLATRQQSFSHARVLVGRERSRPLEAVRGLVVLLGERLRAEGRAARQVHAGGDSQGVRVKVEPPSASERLLLKLVTHAWAREMGDTDRGTVWAQAMLARQTTSAYQGWWSEGEPAVTPLDVAVDRVRARFGRERLVPGHTTWGFWAGQKISFVRVPGG